MRSVLGVLMGFWGLFVLGCPPQGQPVDSGLVVTVPEAAPPPEEESEDADIPLTLHASPLDVSDASVAVFFSPRGGCQDEVIRLINSAKLTVYVQAYGFTSKPIIAAILAAKSRGIDVEIVIDKSDDQDGGAPITALNLAHVQVLVDKQHAIAHNKVIIVDNLYVETGSFNYTYNAEYRNAENCIFLRDTTLATTYTQNFNIHKLHSVVP